MLSHKTNQDPQLFWLDENKYKGSELSFMHT